MVRKGRCSYRKRVYKVPDGSSVTDRALTTGKVRDAAVGVELDMPVKAEGNTWKRETRGRDVECLHCQQAALREPLQIPAEHIWRSTVPPRKTVSPESSKSIVFLQGVLYSTATGSVIFA